MPPPLPACVAGGVADFNGDGKSDVLVRGVSGWDTTPVYFSNGDGTFKFSNAADSTKNIFNLLGAQAFVGDFNGDGKTDVLVKGISGWDTMPVFFSNGDGTFNGSELTALIAAGYTNVADAAHSVWKKTRQSFSFNPYLNINPSTPSTDEAFTESLMDDCVATLGKRCSLENNSIRYPNNPGAYAQMYAHMVADQTSDGVAIDFQTATLDKLDTSPEQGLGAVLKWACGGFGDGVHAIEAEIETQMTD